jgi:putative methionine-R-sulfoxide reductase with GAF domain
MYFTSGLILDVDRDENSDYDEDDREFLKTLFKPFLAFAAKAQEATYQIGG